MIFGVPVTWEHQTCIPMRLSPVQGARGRPQINRRNARGAARSEVNSCWDEDDVGRPFYSSSDCCTGPRFSTIGELHFSSSFCTVSTH